MKSGFTWFHPAAGLLAATAAVMAFCNAPKSPPPSSPGMRAPAVESSAESGAAEALRTLQGAALDARLWQLSAQLTDSDRLGLIQRITDDTKLRRFFDRLLSDAAEQAPQSVIPMWDSLPEDADRSAWFLPIAKGWTRRDPTEAASWLGDQPPCESRDRALLLAVAAAAETGDTAMALQQLRSLDVASPDRQTLATQVLSEALRANPASAAHWRSRMPGTDTAYLPAVAVVAHELAGKNVQAAVDLIDTAIDPGPPRDRLLASVVDAAAMARPEAYVPWALVNLSDSARDEALARWTLNWESKDPVAFKAWCATECPPEVLQRLAAGLTDRRR